MDDAVIERCDEFIELNPEDPTGYFVRGMHHVYQSDGITRTVLFTSERYAHRNFDDFYITHVVDKPLFKIYRDSIKQHKERLKESLWRNPSLVKQIDETLVVRLFQPGLEDEDWAVFSHAWESTVDDQVVETCLYMLFEMAVDASLGLALTDFNRVIDLDPHCALAYVYRARVCHLSTGELDRPLDDLDRAILEAPDMVDAYWLRYLQLTFYSDGDDEMNAYLEEQIQKDSYTGLWPHPGWLWEAFWLRGVFSAQLCIARNDFSLGSIRQVVADLDEATDLKPDEGKVYLDRAKAWLLLGEPDRAMKDLSSAYRYSAQSWDPGELDFLYGMAHYLRGELSGVIFCCNLAIHENPKHISAHRAKGDAHLERGEFREAIGAYDNAFKVCPDPSTFAARADCHKGMGKHRLAIADYDVAIGMAPESYRIRWGRGLVHFAMDEYQRYIDDIEKADEMLASSTETVGLVMRPTEHVRSVRRSLLNFSVKPYVVEVLAQRADLLLGGQHRQSVRGDGSSGADCLDTPLFLGLDSSPRESQDVFTNWETGAIGLVRIGRGSRASEPAQAKARRSPGRRINLGPADP